MTDDVQKLVDYRLEQAYETLVAAKELFANQHLRDAVNRAYYAMFYASLGLLASRMLGSSRHSGVGSLFGKHFVKTGLFAPETGKFLREAFELRQKCDYREFVDIRPDQVEELIAHAGSFIKEANRTWEEIRKGSS